MKFTDFHNSELAEASKTRNPTRDFLRNNPVSSDEMAKPVKQMSVPELATVSDEALDNAYHYGRSTPGNAFGWQANLKSAAFAKQMIDKGVTDIEQISDAIHKGWNVTARAFVQNPDQFDDTEKLKAAGKLEAKLQQRAKLMNIEYAQLPDDEQEKDRVVARALLQAIKGQQGVAEGLSEPTRKVFFKVIKTQGTGMPSGYRRVKTMRPLEDGGFYIELSTPGYGMDYTRHNYKNFSLKDDQGKPITGQEANNIINGKQGMAEGDILPFKIPADKVEGNYEQLNYRKNPADKYAVIDHTFNGKIILTTNKFAEAKKEAIEWAEYDDILTSVQNQQTGKNVLVVDGYAGAEKYMQEDVAEEVEQMFHVKTDQYGANKDVPLYTKTYSVRANSEQEAINTVIKIFGGTNHRIKQDVAEGNIWHGTDSGSDEADNTDHNFEEATQYIKGAYPFHKTYNVYRAEPGFRALFNPRHFLKGVAHTEKVDSGLDQLQLKRNPMMSGGAQVSASIGYSWSVLENASTGIALLYYQDRGMGSDQVIIAAKDKQQLAGALGVFRDAGVIPDPSEMAARKAEKAAGRTAILQKKGLGVGVKFSASSADGSNMYKITAITPSGKVKAVNLDTGQVRIWSPGSISKGMLQTGLYPAEFDEPRQGVAEEYNPEYDDEAGMADNNLSTLRRAVDGLDDLIDTGDNLPEWCQEKIAVAKSMLVNVWDYMESEEQGVTEGEKWIQKAVNPKTKGNLHKALHVPQDETIPKSRIAQAIHSADPHLRHMAQFAKNVAKEDAGGMGTGSVATSMGAGNGFANGGPGTITRRRK